MCHNIVGVEILGERRGKDCTFACKMKCPFRRLGLLSRKCMVVNPRRACAARVTVVVPCVCVCVCVSCFRGPHLQLTQLSDKVGILAVSV